MKLKLQEDLKLAMKARDQLRLGTLRGVISEIKKAEIDSRTELTEEKIVDIVQREVKKRRDTIEFAKTAGRTDVIEGCDAEIAILQEYLGVQLSAAELRGIVQNLIAGGLTAMGPIMGALSRDYKGKFEGKVASEIVKELTSNPSTS